MRAPVKEHIKVLLIDEESRFRTGLAKALKACPDVSVIGEVDNSLEAVDKALKIKPHVILTEITTPRSQWQQIVSSLKDGLPNARLVILTNSEKDEDVLEALSSGVDGYLLKGSKFMEIVQAVLKSAAGELVFNPVIANRLVAEFGRSMGTPKLSERETQVLRLLGEGISNAEIAERLCVSGSTVRTYVYRIIEKLNLNNRSDVVAYGARHYLAFTRIAEGFKALRTQSEQGHVRISTPDISSVEQRSLTDTAYAATRHAPETAHKETVVHRLAAKGERSQVTAVVASIEPFSRISGNLTTEETDELTDQCLELIGEEVRRYNGVVAWSRGHGLMALFGIMESQEYGSQLALYASLAIRECLQGYIEQLNKRGLKSDVRIGINSGIVSLEKGTDGSIVDYKPVGNTVESAMSICDRANAGAILVTQSTYRLTEGFFEFKPFGEAEVKGEGKPIEVYELFKPTHAKTRFQVRRMRGLTKFVGRERELSLLCNCFDKVKEGRGQVVGMVGESGVGKSRLLLEFNSKLSSETYAYLEGSCLFYGESTAYLPLLRVLRSYFDIQEGEEAASINGKIREGIVHLDQSLSAFVPPLQDVLSSQVAHEAYMKLEPAEKREKIFEAVRNFLISLSQKKPLVLTIEDLHWIDKTSEELIAYLIDGLARTKIMLMLSYRPEYDHVWNKKSYYTQINLDELSSKSAGELVRATLNEADVSSELNDFILKRCGGNPLFIEEFIRYQLEKGLIIKKHHEYALSDTKPATLVPETTQGVIAARIDRLDDKLKHVLQVASVIGNEFTPQILPLVSGIEKGLDSILQGLQGLELIHMTNLLPQPEYAFKHAITREAVYNSLSLRSRRGMHQKIGEALEKLNEGKLDIIYETLAYHYSKSNNLEKAYLYLKLTADKAQASYSNWEAIRLYKEALDILHRLPDSEEKTRKDIEIRYQLVIVMESCGYRDDDALQILEEGERLSRSIGDERRVAWFCSSIGTYYTQRGRSLEGRKYIEKAFRSAQLLKDVDLMVAIGFDLCRAYAMAGESFKVVELASSVVQEVEKMQRGCLSPGDKTPKYYSYILILYGYAEGCIGNFEHGQALCEESLKLARINNDKFEVCYAECLYGWLLIHKGDLENALEHLQSAISYCEEFPFLATSGMAWTGKGQVYYLMGELEIARQYAEKAIQMQRDAGVEFILSITYRLLGMIHFDRCDLKKAQSYFEEALRLSQNNNEKYAEGLSLIYLGRVLALENPSKRTQAEELISRGIDMLEALKARVWSTQGYFHLGKVYADTSQREKALETLKKAETSFQEMGMQYWLRKTQEALADVQS